MSDREYLKEIIRNILQGSSDFFLEIEKEKVIRFLALIENKISNLPSSKDEFIELVKNTRSRSEIDQISLLADKTITNIHAGEGRLDLNKRKLIIERYLSVLASIEHVELDRLTILVDGQPIPNEILPYAFLSIGKSFSKIRGGLASEYGKAIDQIYLEFIVKSLNIPMYEDIYDVKDETISCLLNKRWHVEDKELKLESGSTTTPGREIDCLIFTLNKDKIIPLVIIEFTVSGRGNDDAMTNKVKNIAGYSEVCEKGVIFISFDSDNLVYRNAGETIIINFKLSHGSGPLEIVLNTLKNRIAKLDLTQLQLPDLSEARTNFNRLTKDYLSS